MDPKDLGLAPGATEHDKALDDKAKEDGTVADDKGKGGEDDKGKKPADGVVEDPKDKRINDLMSKWQGEESAHNKTKDELAKANKGGDDKSKADDVDKDTPYFLKQGWKPATYEDLGKALADAAKYGSEAAVNAIKGEAQTKEQIKADVEGLIKEISEADEEFDEDDFFKYAGKIKFPVKTATDLKIVYSAYHTQRQAIKAAGKVGKEGDDKNKNDKKINKPGAGDGKTNAIPYSKTKGKSILEVATESFNRRK